MEPCAPMDVEALAARVEKLARENRLHRAAATSLLLLAGAALLTGQAPAPRAADEVRARRFVLADASGQTRGAFTLAPDGSTLLVLADAQHRVRVSATVSGEGVPELAFYDGRDRIRLKAGVAAGNVPFVTLANPDATAESASLLVNAAGAPLMKLADAAGRSRLVAGVLDGDVSLALLGAENKMSAVLALDRETPRLALADSTGTDRVWVAIRKESGVLQFLDKNRVPRTGLATINDDKGLAVMSESTGPSLPGLALYGKDQALLWSAPGSGSQ